MRTPAFALTFAFSLSLILFSGNAMALEGLDVNVVSGRPVPGTEVPISISVECTAYSDNLFQGDFVDLTFEHVSGKQAVSIGSDRLFYEVPCKKVYTYRIDFAQNSDTLVINVGEKRSEQSFYQLRTFQFAAVNETSNAEFSGVATEIIDIIPRSGFSLDKILSGQFLTKDLLMNPAFYGVVILAIGLILLAVGKLLALILILAGIAMLVGPHVL